MAGTLTPFEREIRRGGRLAAVLASGVMLVGVFLFDDRALLPGGSPVDAMTPRALAAIVPTSNDANPNGFVPINQARRLATYHPRNTTNALPLEAERAATGPTNGLTQFADNAPLATDISNAGAAPSGVADSSGGTFSNFGAPGSGPTQGTSGTFGNGGSSGGVTPPNSGGSSSSSGGASASSGGSSSTSGGVATSSGGTTSTSGGVATSSGATTTTSGGSTTTSGGVTSSGGSTTTSGGTTSTSGGTTSTSGGTSTSSGGSGNPPVGAVPEPATWATMLIGFLMIGTGLRRTRRGRREVSA